MLKKESLKEMENYFGSDTRRISHARKVTNFALDILDVLDFINLCGCFAWSNLLDGLKRRSNDDAVGNVHVRRDDNHPNRAAIVILDFYLDSANLILALQLAKIKIIT